MTKNEALQLEVFPTGDLATNAYLVINKSNQECFLVDCPAPIDEYRDFIKRNNLKLKFLVITHSHYDHIDGLELCLQEFSTPFYIQKNDFPMLINPLKNGSLLFKSSPISIKQQPVFCKEGDQIVFGKYQLRVIETPGHTQGSISLQIGQWLFGGDTIFYHSIGRTDLPFSDEAQLKQSIVEKIFTLKPETIIYPGHGETTSVGEEIKNNPFF